jgi:hypothetical protein
MSAPDDDAAPGAQPSPPPRDGFSARDPGDGDERRCERCGGSHTSRQRCPLDPQPAQFTATPMPEWAARGDEVRHYGAPPTSFYGSPRARSTYAPLRPVGGVQNGCAQWAAALVCSIVLIVCVSVCGVYIARLPEVAHSVGDTVAVIFIAAALGAIFGVVPLYFFARAYAALAYGLLALTLIAGGVMMLAIAPIVRQMNVLHLAEYTGFWGLICFGLLSTALGLALAVICFRWAQGRDARQRLARWGRSAGALYGVLLGLLGMLLMLSLLVLINRDADEFEEPSVVQQGISFTTIAMLSLVPGLILTYHSISESMGEGSGEPRVPLAASILAVFGGVLLLGHLNMQAESPMALPMPLLHVLAAALPGVGLIALAGRGSWLSGRATSGLTWRQLTMSGALAMTLAVSIAGYVEGLGGISAVLLLLVHNGVFEFASNADDVTDIIDFAEVVLSRNEQFVGLLIVGAVLAPISEEIGKSLGVRFLMPPNATRAQCFLLGAAAGAAFGFVEALTYGLGVISEDLGDWWWIMLARAGTTSMHVLCSGMAGIGWWYWTVARRTRPALALFAGAMLIHALWNGVLTVLYSRIFLLETLDSDTLDNVVSVVIAIASIVIVAAIPLVAQRLRESDAPPVAGTPLAGMQAWLG